MGVADIFKQVGNSLKGATKPANYHNVPQTTPGATPANAIPPFDFKIYMEAWKVFFKDFFGRQVPEFFQDMGTHLQNFKPWWDKQQQDDQAAYGGVVFGFLMIVVGVILIIVI